MKSIPLTKGEVALVDDEDFEYLNQWKWHVNLGYARRSINIGMFEGKQLTKRILMHRLIMNVHERYEVDHINGIRHDNRKNNLRICRAIDNRKNRRKSSGTSSNYKGITWHKKDKMWQSLITSDGVRIGLGRFKSATDAALSYNKAAIQYHGEFACLNEVKIEKEKLCTHS